MIGNACLLAAQSAIVVLGVYPGRKQRRGEDEWQCCKTNMPQVSTVIHARTRFGGCWKASAPSISCMMARELCNTLTALCSLSDTWICASKAQAHAQAQQQQQQPNPVQALHFMQQMGLPPHVLHMLVHQMAAAGGPPGMGGHPPPGGLPPGLNPTLLMPGVMPGLHPLNLQNYALFQVCLLWNLRACQSSQLHAPLSTLNQLGRLGQLLTLLRTRAIGPLVCRTNLRCPT